MEIIAKILISLIIVNTLRDIILFYKRKNEIKISNENIKKLKEEKSKFIKKILDADAKILKELYRKNFKDGEVIEFDGIYNIHLVKKHIRRRWISIRAHYIGNQIINIPINHPIKKELIEGNKYEVRVAILKNELYLIEIKEEFSDKISLSLNKKNIKIKDKENLILNEIYLKNKKIQNNDLTLVNEIKKQMGQKIQNQKTYFQKELYLLS